VERYYKLKRKETILQRITALYELTLSHNSVYMN